MMDTKQLAVMLADAKMKLVAPTAKLRAMAPDLAAEVIRLTAAREQAYDEAMAHIDKAYNKARRPIDNAYFNALATIHKAREEANLLAQKAYSEATMEQDNE
jgi:vacuolar-type H+-ATPase subunit H